MSFLIYVGATVAAHPLLFTSRKELAHVASPLFTRNGSSNPVKKTFRLRLLGNSSARKILGVAVDLCILGKPGSEIPR